LLEQIARARLANPACPNEVHDERLLQLRSSVLR
jgi:hypothetical protein